MPDIKVDWSDENVAKIRRMWSDGFTASQIADEIPNASRSAIIGKLHRLGLRAKSGEGARKPTKREQRRISATKPRVPRSTASLPQRKTVKRASLPTPEQRVERLGQIDEEIDRVSTIESETDTAVEYLQMREHHCRALLTVRGSDGLPMCCGKTRLRKEGSTVFASSYCPAHDRLFVPGTYNNGDRRYG